MIYIKKISYIFRFYRVTDFSFKKSPLKTDEAQKIVYYIITISYEIMSIFQNFIKILKTQRFTH